MGNLEYEIKGDLEVKGVGDLKDDYKIEVEGVGDLEDHSKGNLMSEGNFEYEHEGDLKVKDEGKGYLTIKELESNLIELVSLLKALCCSLSVLPPGLDLGLLLLLTMVQCYFLGEVDKATS